jgi:CheY-like chemotaxis protein
MAHIAWRYPKYFKPAYDGFISGGCAMRTIIVEDHAVVAADLRVALEDLGHLVIGVASSFSAAVDLLLTAHNVELALVDLCLGDDDADEPFGAFVVDLAASRSIPVVVTTGLAPIPDQLKGAGLLVKPFSSEQLASVIASIETQPVAARRDMVSRPGA